MTEAFIGLGSNVGDRLAFLTRAIEELKALGPLRVSRIYETSALGPPQADFLNAVAAIETSLSPRELFEALKRIELTLGRIPRARWGPREIDLDLLLYGDEQIDEPDLKVPHPEMSKRAFVLVPLVELAPDAFLPNGQMLSDLLHDVSESSGVRVFDRGATSENHDEAQWSM